MWERLFGKRQNTHELLDQASSFGEAASLGMPYDQAALYFPDTRAVDVLEWQVRKSKTNNRLLQKLTHIPPSVRWDQARVMVESTIIDPHLIQHPDWRVRRIGFIWGYQVNPEKYFGWIDERTKPGEKCGFGQAVDSGLSYAKAMAQHPQTSARDLVDWMLVYEYGPSVFGFTTQDRPHWVELRDAARKKVEHFIIERKLWANSEEWFFEMGLKLGMALNPAKYRWLEQDLGASDGSGFTPY